VTSTVISNVRGRSIVSQTRTDRKDDSTATKKKEVLRVSQKNVREVYETADAAT